MHFKREIEEPLNAFSNEFNNKSVSGKIEFYICDFSNGSFGGIIDLPNAKRIKIEIEMITDKTIRRMKFNGSGGRAVGYENVAPFFMKREIYAWGTIDIDKYNGIGFNIFLLKNKEDVYGEWFMVKNLNHGLSKQSRQEPFAYKLHELRQEITNMDSSAFSEKEVLDEKKLFGFITNCLL